MIKLATDEDFNNRILRGVLRRNPQLDVRRVQDAAIGHADDPHVLAWAASEGRVLLTHDASTLIADAYQRVKHALPMPGVFEIRQDVPIGVAIEEVLFWPNVVWKASGKGTLGIFRCANATFTPALPFLAAAVPSETS